MARSLSLPWAEKSSMKLPPPLTARKATPTRTRIQVVRVRQGCWALAMATARVNLFMVVPLEGVQVAAKLGTDVVRGRHHTW